MVGTSFNGVAGAVRVWLLACGGLRLLCVSMLGTYERGGHGYLRCGGLLVEERTDSCEIHGERLYPMGTNLISWPRYLPISLTGESYEGRGKMMDKRRLYTLQKIRQTKVTRSRRGLRTCLLTRVRKDNAAASPEPAMSVN
jgi:hypothetical protein